MDPGYACQETNVRTKESHFSRESPTTNAKDFIFQTDPILPDKSEPPNISTMDYKLVTSVLAFCPVPSVLSYFS